MFNLNQKAKSFQKHFILTVVTAKYQFNSNFDLDRLCLRTSRATERGSQIKGKTGTSKLLKAFSEMRYGNTFKTHSFIGWIAYLCDLCE